MTVTYPLDFEANIVTGPGTTNNKMSTWTGFHPVQTTIKSEFIECFPGKTVGKIRIYGYTRSQVASVRSLAAAPTNVPLKKIVLRPYYEDGVLAGFEVEDAPEKNTLAKTKFPLAANGDLVLEEKDIYNLGIEITKTFQLWSWKNMAEDAVDYANQNIVVQGYTDTYFEKQRTIRVTTENHLDSFREAPLDLPLFTAGQPLVAGSVYGNANTVADNYIVSYTDSSLYFVSKMYYDAVSRAAYADVMSGEAVEDKNEADANKSPLEQAVGKKFELAADKSAFDTTLYSFDEKDVCDGYLTIPEANLGSYVYDEDTPEASKTTVYVYQENADPTKPGTYVEATLGLGAPDADGNPTYTYTVGALTLPAKGVGFYTYDAGAIHDGYTAIPAGSVKDYLTNGKSVFVNEGGSYQEAVLVKGEEEDGGSFDITYWLMGEALSGAPADEKATAKWILRNANYDIVVEYAISDPHTDENGNEVPAVPKGHVISATETKPAADGKRAVVTVVVSRGTTEEAEGEAGNPMADLVGKTEQYVRDQIAAMNDYEAQSEVKYEYSDQAAGTVIAITPAPDLTKPILDDNGNPVLDAEGNPTYAPLTKTVSDGNGGTILVNIMQLTVSLGAYVKGEFEDYLEMTPEAAKKALADDGYEVLATEEEANDDIKQGEIIRIVKDKEAWDETVANPDGSTSTVHHPTQVHLVVSSGLTPQTAEKKLFESYAGQDKDTVFQALRDQLHHRRG